MVPAFRLCAFLKRSIGERHGRFFCAFECGKDGLNPCRDKIHGSSSAHPTADYCFGTRKKRDESLMAVMGAVLVIGIVNVIVMVRVVLDHFLF